MPARREPVGGIFFLSVKKFDQSRIFDVVFFLWWFSGEKTCIAASVLWGACALCYLGQLLTMAARRGRPATTARRITSLQDVPILIDGSAQNNSAVKWRRSAPNRYPAGASTLRMAFSYAKN